MIKYITVFLIFVLPQLLTAQINFFQTGATWGYSSIEHPDTPWDPYRIWLEQISITGDTILNNINYKKLHRHIKETQMPGSIGGPPNVVSYDNSFEYLRFDSLNNKVFYINDNDLNERVIYDFNLSVGDTIPNEMGSGPLVIDSLENIFLFGYTVKKYYYASDTSSTEINSDQYIIEGMGSSNGLTSIRPHDVLVVSSHIVTDIICFQFENNVYPSGSSCDVFLNVDPDSYPDGKNIFQISIYPNPYNKNFKIHFPADQNNITIKFYDSIGKEIFSKSVHDNDEINNSLPTGVYYLKLIADDTLIYSGKVLHIEED